MISAFWPQAIEDDDNVHTEGGNQDIESGDDADLLSLVRDFEEKESDHEIAFSGINGISCFAHTWFTACGP